MAEPAENEGALLARILAHGLTPPDAPALIAGDVVLTHAGLRAAVLAGAAQIWASARPDGSGRVASLAGNTAAHVLGYLATVAAGFCAVPLPLASRPEVLRGMLADCDPDLVLLDDDGRVALDGAPDAAVLDLAVPPAAPPLSQPVAADPDAAFNVIYSSGTTGRPKGIVQPHAMRFRQSVRTMFDLGPQSVTLLATPLCSNTTLLPLLATLTHGGRVVLMQKFDAGGYLALARTHRATHTMLVPVQYGRILAHPDFPATDLGSFRLKQTTGAPMDPALKRRVVDAWPGRFLEVYGLTEGGCTVILDASAHPDKAGTVGRPAPGNEVRVIDAQGRPVPQGEVGEVIGRSATMMSGYLNRPDATQAFRMEAEGGAFHRTGDLGRFDADGFLVLVGRIKDVIISGGFNIYASDLEAVLEADPEVAEAAVIGVPSADWGETPVGFVARRGTVAGDRPADWAETLRQRANARLGKTQRLHAVVALPALPRSDLGKVLKTALKAQWETEGRG